MSADITPYTDLVTSEYASQPNFNAVLTALLQPIADVRAVVASMPELYDLDVAVGVQLDTVGIWIGQSRNLLVPITDVYFSFDIEGLGFDQGTWQGEFDPDTELSTLPDDAYRTLLRAKIAANNWQGSIPEVETILDTLYADEGFKISIVDNQDMTMELILTAPAAPNAVTQALFLGGYLDLKPVGVAITKRILISSLIPDTANLSLVGHAPTMDSQGSIGSASLGITGNTPTVVNGIVTYRTPTVGDVSITGNVPTRSQGTQTFITPSKGTVTIAGKQVTRTP